MRRLFEEAIARMTGFAAQRDAVALVLSYAEQDHPMVAAVAKAAEEQSAALWFCFAEPFGDAYSYLAALEHWYVPRADAYAEAFSAEGWNAPRYRAADAARLPPPERLRALLSHARDLRPHAGLHTAFALLPPRIAQGDHYVRLLAEALHHEMPAPWCHHLRVFARDDARAPMLEPRLDAFRRAELARLDFGAAALERAMIDDVGDDALPLRERMQSLLTLASMDRAHGRSLEAIEKYDRIVRYGTQLRLPLPVALAHEGLGALALQAGSLEHARTCFDQSMAVAEELEAWPLLHTLTGQMAELAGRAGALDEAAEYHETGAALGSVMRSPTHRMMSLEALGTVRAAQRDHAGAMDAWEGAAKLARAFGEDATLARVKASLAPLYVGPELRARQRAFEQELASIVPGQPSRVGAA